MRDSRIRPLIPHRSSLILHQRALFRGIAVAWFLGVLVLCGRSLAAGGSKPEIRVLFLGDNGHHRPAERFRQLQPVFRDRGIELTYSDRVDDLNPRTLADYDGLLIYANIDRIELPQEQALLDYVAGGRGLIAVHCASYCFLNSSKYVELVGAQFQRHNTGVFRTQIAEPDHPVMKGFHGFESWDETYVHHRHNETGRTVLSYRVDETGREPWTWVRTQGRGRVFYTAWGHDSRTWGHPGFQNLLERGVRWAVGRDPGTVPAYVDRPSMTPQPDDLKPFQYVKAKVPYYPAGQQWGVTGEPINRMQSPLEPEESRKHMVTPVGFEVKLFAAEPDIIKPISMNWDERGRLWICETVDYPNNKQPDGRGSDRIRICEDTDGDGRADKFTVFAEGLSIPTSLTFAYGGVIVHQPPHTLFLKDTDGDDVADQQTVLFTGWSTRDTHAGPSNLRYGLDNWYYGMVGYAGFEGEVGGERHSFRTGFYRFRVEADDSGRVRATKLEFIRNTSNNSWGVGFTEEGQLLGSTANGNPSVHVTIPNRYYERVRGWSSRVLDTIAMDSKFDPITENVRQVDFHGRFTAGAGHAVYTARTYPPEYWNRTAFVNGPTGHLTACFVLERNGSSYWSRNAWNLLASDDEWTAPIMADVGPDGQVWVIDWYNYIVQHNPTPPGYRTGKGSAYVSDLRDKRHGRIYRVVYKRTPAAGWLGSNEVSPQPSFLGAPLRSDPSHPNAAPRLSLADASPEELVQTLRHPNMLWRLHAQRLLVERRRDDVLPALIQMAADSSVDQVGLNPGVIHALWTLHGLGALDGSHPQATAVAVNALRHPSAGVRQNAVRVLPPTERSLHALLDSGVLHDADAQVRLAALLAMSDMPSPRSPFRAEGASPGAAAAEAVVAALKDPGNLQDRWIVEAATSAAATNAEIFLRFVAGSNVADAPSVSDVYQSTLLEVVERIAEHYARGKPTETVEPILKRLPTASRQIAAAVIAGLARGWPESQMLRLHEETEQGLVEFAPKLQPEARSQLVSWAIRAGSTKFEQYAAEIAQTLLKQAQDDGATNEKRLAAAQNLIALRRDNAESAAQLLELIAPRTDPALSAGVLEAVRASRSAAVGAAIVDRWASMTPNIRQTALPVLLSRTEWTQALLDGIEHGRISLSDLSLPQKRSLTTHPNKAVAERAKQLLARGGGLPSPDRQKVLEERLPLARRNGDPALGQQVFKKHCTKCHTHGEEGETIGPDLTGMAVHTKAELLTQILDPSRNVEGNFRMYTVVTADGLVLNGLLASETKTSLEVVDTDGKRHDVLRDDVEQLLASEKSAMPDGFEKQLSESDLVNLLAFLTQRTRFVPIPLYKAATIVSTQGMFFTKEDRVGRLVFRDWSPKTVAGVPFHLVDPKDGRQPNVIMLYGPQGTFPPQMPKSVALPCHIAAKAVHFLSGVSGWGFPLGEKGSVSMIVRLHYADGKTEDHALKNGIQFGDYIRRVDVPGSQFAFKLRNQQIRYFAIEPERDQTIDQIELIKGEDRTAPIVMAVTVETR